MSYAMISLMDLDKEAQRATKHLLPTSVRLPNEPGLAAMSHTGEGNVQNSQEMVNMHQRNEPEAVFALCCTEPDQL